MAILEEAVPHARGSFADLNTQFGSDNFQKTLHWESEVSRCESKLKWISPSANLPELETGSVLISKSGNARLALNVDKQNGKARFLSKRTDGSVRIESSKLTIGLERVAGIVSRKSGNPLVQFKEISQNIRSFPEVVFNTEILLLAGHLGDYLSEELDKMTPDISGLTTIYFSVSAESGKIRSIENASSSGETFDGRYLASGNVPVGLQFHTLNLPADEYIENALFYRSSNEKVRTAILAACVLSNTLQNAINFMHLRRLSSSSI